MILNDVTKSPAWLAFINIYICDARGTKIAIDMGTIFILDLLEFSKWPKILFSINFKFLPMQPRKHIVNNEKNFLD